MKYPYIGQQYSAIILFYAENKGLVVGDALGLDESTQVGDKVELPDGVNITREYLSNTWGVVESKEHAEFIIELAELHGFEFTTGTNKDYPCWFTFDDELYFFKSKVYASNDSRKQITIPLPPKFNKTSEILNPNNVKVELSNPEPLKNAGDNLILGCEDSIDNLCDRVAEGILKKNPVRLGCEDSKGDEWPQVGDEVEVRHDSGQVLKGELLAITSEYAIIQQLGHEQHLYLSAWKFSKPKTPEEELRDESNSPEFPDSSKRNKSKQAYEILKSLDYDYDLVKQKWFKKEYI